MFSRRNFRLILLLVFLTFLVLYYKQTRKVMWPKMVKNGQNRTKDRKLILEWTGIINGGVHIYWKRSSRFCPELVPLCKFSADKSLIHKADAVSFYIRQLGWSLADLPEVRYEHQRYIMYIGESAAHTKFDLTTVEWFFNWTMTTRMDSDIWWPYGQFVPINEPSPHVPSDFGDIKRMFRRKTKLVAWFVSNCYTDSKREKYVAELAKYIPVDIYSYKGCGKLKCDWKKENCNKKLANEYFFYLAFENSVCDDYVTEKFYLTIQYYVVPVVLRAKDYQKLDPEGFPMAPNSSFISVDNFSTPLQLATYLRYVANNEHLYLSFLEWHKKMES